MTLIEDIESMGYKVTQVHTAETVDDAGEGVEGTPLYHITDTEETMSIYARETDTELIDNILNPPENVPIPEEPAQPPASRPATS